MSSSKRDYSYQKREERTHHESTQRKNLVSHDEGRKSARLTRVEARKQLSVRRDSTAAKEITQVTKEHAEIQ